MEVIRGQPTKDGLIPIFMSPESGGFIMSDVRLGSRGDSYFEYLSKQYFQTNRTEPVYRQMHEQAMRGIAKHLVKKSVTRDLVFTSELLPRRSPKTGELELVDTPKQDHLVCFLGATLLLGVTDGNTLPVPPDESTFTAAQREDWYLGKQLTKTCVDTYFASKTGLAPEIVNFFTHKNDAKRYGREWFINSRQPGPDTEPPIDARNILRPETAESLFVAYRVTGDPIYRDWVSGGFVTGATILGSASLILKSARRAGASSRRSRSIVACPAVATPRSGTSTSSPSSTKTAWRPSGSCVSFNLAACARCL